MSNEIVVQQFSDGFDEHTDRTDIEGEEPRQGVLMVGTKLKFTNEAAWTTVDGPIDPDMRPIAERVTKAVQLWKDKEPAETIIIEPGSAVSRLG